jgi:hypothetical protein
MLRYQEAKLLIEHWYCNVHKRSHHDLKFQSFS